MENHEPKIEKQVSIGEQFGDLRMFADAVDHYQSIHELTEEQKTIIEKGLSDSLKPLANLFSQVADWSKIK